MKARNLPSKINHGNPCFGILHTQRTMPNTLADVLGVGVRERTGVRPMLDANGVPRTFKPSREAVRDTPPLRLAAAAVASLRAACTCAAR